MRGTAAALALVLGSPPGSEPSPAPAPQITPPSTPLAGPPAVGELSRQGTRHGALEIGLGVVLSGTAIGLVAFGTIQLIRAREQLEFCNRSVDFIHDGDNDSGGGIDPCVFDAPPLGFASAGLSWGFAIPLLVGGGLLFARAHRVRADARAFRATELSAAPWGRRDGAGLTLNFRF
jgi:hypothetical protein